jgi:hypothetical protein
MYESKTDLVDILMKKKFDIEISGYLFFFSLQQDFGN